VQLYTGFRSSIGRVLHLGANAFLAAERTPNQYVECRLLRCSDQKYEHVAAVSGSITSLTRIGAHRFVAGTRAGDLLLGDVGSMRHTEVSVGQLDLDPYEDWPRAVATDAAGERLAVLGRYLVLTDAQAAQAIAYGYQRTVVAGAALLSSDKLVTSDQRGNLRLLRQMGKLLAPVAQASVPGFGGIAAVPQRGHIAVASRHGNLSFHNEMDLGVTGTVDRRETAKATSLHVSPTGDLLALGYDAGYVDFYDLRVGDLPALVDRPMIDLVPTHLAAVTAAMRDPKTRPGPAGAVLRLLRASLEHRFRFDIELSETGAIAAGEFDIALN
jgi:hypothetical protein